MQTMTNSYRNFTIHFDSERTQWTRMFVDGHCWKTAGDWKIIDVKIFRVNDNSILNFIFDHIGLFFHILLRNGASCVFSGQQNIPKGSPLTHYIQVDSSTVICWTS